MKKIAIITLTGNFNYGNRLQNYALQTVLEKKNFKVETIWREKEQRFNLKLKIYNMYINFLAFIKCLKSGKNFLKLNKERKNRFLEFAKYVNISKYESKGIMSKEVNDMYDLFVVGSDQVWNHHLPDVNDNNFLTFADKEKTFAYAASFGINEIEDEKQNYYIEKLNHINYISVREIAGQNIVKELIGKDVPVVLDPTLLLDKKDWDKVCENVKLVVPKKYLLIYFLGDIENKTKEKIIEFANKKKLEIVSLRGINDDFYYKSGPADFVYLFKNASYVITDSFHGTAFSIIYNKNFNVLYRKTIASMNSRIDSILELVGLQDRIFDNINNNKDIDYTEVEKKLNKLKKHSYDYMDDFLKS